MRLGVGDADSAKTFNVHSLDGTEEHRLAGLAILKLFQHVWHGSPEQDAQSCLKQSKGVPSLPVYELVDWKRYFSSYGLRL